MWYESLKYRKQIKDINEELAMIQGEMGEEEAKISLAKFLYRNLGFTVELISGVKLYPDQIIMLKGMMKSNYSLFVLGRGLSKSFTAAIFAFLQCLFEPNTQILIAGPTFRTARFIFNNIEKIADSPEATMLATALGIDKQKRNDEFKWNINGGSIVAIPLNGEKIRGFRANVLVIDEFLLMSPEIVEKVLIPYLVAQQDLKKVQLIREREDNLIQRGLMKDTERYKLPNRSKMVALSSASYECEYLAKKFQEYVKEIYSPDMPENQAIYHIQQMSWDVVDPDRLDKSIIELAQSNEANTATFKREYCAQFIDGSEGFFSLKQMIRQTIPDGEEPSLLLKGKKDKKYILSIDPAYSNSATGDSFAMCLSELDDTGEKFTSCIVNQYAESGRDIKYHLAYLHYLLVSFNIVLVIIDHAGFQLVTSGFEAELFRKDKLDLKVFEISAEKDGEEYAAEMKKARNLYNRQMQKIVFTQYFTSDFIRKANEWLQGCIDTKRVWFGSSIKGNVNAFNAAKDAEINYSEVVDMGKLEKNETPVIAAIDQQELLIKQVKYQCASIEVKTTAKGTQTFDLPQSMKRNLGVDRPRRDSYTALMLNCWAVKVYQDIMTAPESSVATFEPVLI